MSERREWIIALAAAWILIGIRSLVFVAYEQAYFDSDQAVIGLMAKHLAEGRAYPLFFYGQSYMLATEAWVAAPFMWLFGPNVLALRLALVSVNLAAVTLLITTLWQGAGLRPAYALVATLFFAIAPPFTSALLVEAQGGSIEPFVYVGILWWLRRRPLWFGAVLGAGFLNREFTLYVVPVLLLGHVITGTLWRPANVRAWLLIAVSFFAAWEGANALKPYADLLGPGTRGQLLRGFAGSQLADVSNRTSVSLLEVPTRMTATVTQFWARLLDARAVDGVVAQGHDWLWWPLMMALALLTLRVLWLQWRGGLPLAQRTAFCWYLVGIGSVAMLAYAVARVPADGTLRYLLLSLLVPIGLVAGLLVMEPRRAVRAVSVAAVLAWGAISVSDNAMYIRRYVFGHQPNELRVVADALILRGVTVAEADYWRAYKLTFLTGERVRIASTDVVRISEYQDLAVSAGAHLRRVQQAACPGGEPVGSFFLCKPPN